MLHTRRALLLLTLLALLISNAPTAPTKAASQKLSTINAPGGMISRAQATPDGTRVVYVAGYDRLLADDIYADGRADLYSAPAGGGLVINLSETIASRRSVIDFAISPDSQYVVFSVENALQQIELYSVSVIGGLPVQLTAPLESLAQVALAYKVSPDSAKVIYIVDQGADGRNLYVVPINGGTRVKLSPATSALPPQPAGRVSHFAISLDSTTIVYSAAQDNPNLRELYRVAITGGSVTKLNAPINGGQDIAHFVISPTGDRVVYSTEPFFAAQIFSVAITGGEVTPIDTLSAEQFAITPDGSRLIYRGIKNGRNSLFQVAITGGTALTLTTNLLSSFSIDPSSRYLIYGVADIDRSAISYDLSTNTPITLTDSLTTLNSDIKISPNGTSVAYIGKDGSGVQKLFSAPIGGGTPTMLGSFASTETISSFQIAPDSSRVVYLSQSLAEPIDQIYSVPINGGATTRVNASLTPEVEALFLRGISADGKVFYATSQRYTSAGTSNKIIDKLYSAAIDGSSAPTLIDRSRTRVGDVQPGYQVSPDGAYVVYGADSERDEVYELYSVALPASVPVRLNADLPVQGDVLGFAISPDSTMVAYTSHNGFGSGALSVLPIGGGVETPIVAANNGNSRAGLIGFTAQGDRLLYMKSDFANATYDLFSIDLVGGAEKLLVSTIGEFKLAGEQVIYTKPAATYGSPPTDLFRISVAGGQPTTLVGNNIGIIDFQVSADSKRVLYQSAAQFNTPTEPVTLASVPINGGAGVELRTTTSGERFTKVVLSGDSQRVIYTIYTEDLNSASYRLYSQLITDGTTNELVDTNVGAALSFEVAPTSDRIVYIDNAGPDPAVRAKLISTDMTGSISNTIFTDTEQLGGVGFKITPDGKQVVFTLNEDLYSIPITGTAALKLTAKATDGVINTYRLSPTSDRATFITKLNGSVASDLFSVALSGGPVSQVSELPAADRAIEDYSFTPDGLLLYRADQERNDVLDLFSADDADAQPVFTTTSVTITENSGTLSIPVQLSGATTIPLSFSVAQVGGDAIVELDYTLSTPTLSFAAGTTTQEITLIPIDRAGYSGVRTLVLGLIPSGPALATSEPVTTITITISDNDDPLAPSPTSSPTLTPQATPTPQPTQPPAPAQRSLYLPLLRR